MTLEYIDKLRSCSKAKEKEKCLEEAWKNGERKLFEGLVLGLNPYKYFHFNRIALIKDNDDIPDNIDWNTFIRISDLISRQELSEDKIKDYINEWVETSSVEMWNKFYRRILLKKTNLDITIAAYNRAMNRIAKYDIQARKYLCPIVNYQKLQDGKADQFIGGDYFIDPFIPGRRQLLIFLQSQNMIRVWDRNKFIKSPLESKQFLETLPIDIVLDTVYDGQYWYAFDVAPVEEFSTGQVNRTQKERHEALCSLQDVLIDSFEGEVKIIAKKQISANDNNELESAIQDLSDQGFSCAVVKNTELPYKFGKNSNWIKISC